MRTSPESSGTSENNSAFDLRHGDRGRLEHHLCMTSIPDKLRRDIERYRRLLRRTSDDRIRRAIKELMEEAEKELAAMEEARKKENEPPK
jgi:hypothetical protein